jgi:hypothetical protein
MPNEVPFARILLITHFIHARKFWIPMYGELAPSIIECDRGFMKIQDVKR